MSGLDVGGSRYGLDAGLGQGHRVKASLVAGDDIDLGLTRGQGQLELEEETVQLGLGQRVGALVFDRVLGGNHHEGIRQDARLTVD